MSRVICSWAAANWSTLRVICSRLAVELVDALPHRGQIERHRFELRLIGRGRGRRDHVGGGLRNGCGLRCQPAKLPGRTRDHLSDRVAVGLPSQGGNDTNEKNHQETGKGKRDYFAEPQPRSRDQVQFGWVKRRVVRWLGGEGVFGELGPFGELG